MRARRWKAIGFAGLFVISMLLSSCADNAQSGESVSLSVPISTAVTTGGETTNSEFFHDKTIKREDGLYEVFSRRLTDGNEVVHVRYLFLSDGTPVGDRSGDTGSSDSIYLFDSVFESYVEGLGDQVDRVEDSRVYFRDGGYTDFEFDGDRIVLDKVYDASGAPVIEFKFNEYGQLENLKQFDEGGNVVLEVRTTYQTITP